MMTETKKRKARKGAGARPVPERTCIVTRETLPRGELLRFVRAPDGRVVFDIKGNLPGRGAWVKPERAVLEEAVRRNAFARAFRAQTIAPADLLEQTAHQLEAAALEALSLARKAGEAVSGFDKVAAMIGKGRAAVLIEASDGAADGRRKLVALANKAGGGIKIADSLSSEQLSLAFSRPNVIHAAMTHGGLADRFVKMASRAAALSAPETPPAGQLNTHKQSEQ
jgi:predicted RNA-binding protein YlxR (DUF448 family)